MSDLNFINFTLRLFFYAGLAPFTYLTSSKLNSNTKNNNLHFFIMVPILIALSTNLTYVIVMFLTNKTTSDSVNSIIIFLEFGTLILTNIVANAQSFINKLIYWDIVRRIEKITDYFYQHFRKDLNYSKFIRRFLYKILLLVGLPIVTLIISYAINAFQLEMMNLLNIIRLLLNIYFTFEILHPIFYINLVQIFIQKLNAQLQLTSSSHIRPMSLAKIQFEVLKSIKLIHFEIWKLFEDLNIYFGWSILFIFTKLFIEITYNFYQLFVNIQVYTWRSLHYIGS